MRFLATEMFKVIKGISPPIVNKLFKRNAGKILVKTVFSRLEPLSYLGRKIWEIVPIEIKEVDCYNLGIKSDAFARFAKNIFMMQDSLKDTIGVKIQICYLQGRFYIIFSFNLLDILFSNF